MTKAVKNTPLRKAVKRINIEGLIEHLEGLGADALNILRPMDERRKRLQSPERICISPAFVDTIVAILRLLPKQRPGPKKIWSAKIEAIAMMGLASMDLSKDKNITALARQIVAKTGESEPGVRRKLQRIVQSPHFKKMQEDSRKHRPILTVGQYTEAELAELAEQPRTAWIKPLA